MDSYLCEASHMNKAASCPVTALANQVGIRVSGFGLEKG